MNLLRALRLDHTFTRHPVISLTGAGGKTTALFQLARQISNRQRPSDPGNHTELAAIVTSTTHLGTWQIPLADRHIIAIDGGDLHDLPNQGVLLVTGGTEGDRTRPVSEVVLNQLHEFTLEQNIHLLIEADGARQKPLKAPATHEPPVPIFSDMVIHVTGLRALGEPLHEDLVQRAELFSQLSGLPPGATITPQAIVTMLTHPQGGRKNIPPNARRIALLNQADTPGLQSIGGNMAHELLGHFNSVLVGSLQQGTVNTFEHTAGIILAAGVSSRYGSPKQLLDWNGKPFVRHIAETALHAGLEPVVVVTGFHHTEVESALKGLPVTIVHNSDYAQGQSTSIKAGLSVMPPNMGSAVFLLADQPQIPVEVIRALTEAHARGLPAILAPLVLEERRANPVLFDQAAFPDLLQLTGDIGGRAIFSKFKVEYIPWHDDILLLDVDRPEDYQRLVDIEKH